ncbi:MAG: thioredoxin [Bacteroidales bacterium]|nr:thioredoxin [Bacteroidales bacterium]
MVVQITESSFEQEVMQSPIPVVIDFWAEWCGPCRQLMPVVHELAETYEGRVKFVKVNVDECPDLAARFGVMSIPTLVFMKNGEQVQRQVGAVPKPMLLGHIEALL